MRHPEPMRHAQEVGDKAAGDLAATGERTVPGLPREEYWFARHQVAYAWIARHRADAGYRFVVDAGAGEGYGTALLVPAIALEYDGAVCRHVRRTYPNVSVVQANLAMLPLRGDSVDAIVCLQVVEHLWELPAFLRDCRRALRPGGELIVTTPQRLTFSPGLGRGEKPLNPFHVEEFDSEQLDAMLRDAGFADISMRGVRHAHRIESWESAHGSLVAAQVRAAIDDRWPPHLHDFVASVTVDDFAIDIDPLAPADARMTRAQDLLATARTPT